MSADDIISVVSEFQRIVPRGANSGNVRDYLENTVIFIPEDV